MPEEPRLAREILRYFLRNEDAADDLEGIARWRLLEEAVYRRVDDAAQAVEWLVAHGLLHADVTASGGRIFSLEGSNRQRAEELVQQKPPDSEGS